MARFTPSRATPPRSWKALWLAHREELELTEQQSEKLKTFLDKLREDREKTTKEIREKQLVARKGDDREEVVRLNKTLQDTLSDSSKKLDDLLTHKLLTSVQKKRIGEIRLQAEGPGAFNQAELKEKLALSAEQDEAIAKILNKYNRESFELSNLPQSSRPSVREDKDSAKSKNFAKLVDSTREKLTMSRYSAMQMIKKELIAAQQEKYRLLVGKPFDFVQSKKAKDQNSKKVEQPDSK